MSNRTQLRPAPELQPGGVTLTAPRSLPNGRSHPRWCAPSLCANDTGGVDHRGEPLVLLACDHELSIGQVRYDEVLADGEVSRGDDRVRFRAEDQACVSSSGDPIAVEVDLTAGEARRLAAQLLHVAARVERLAGAR